VVPVSPRSGRMVLRWILQDAAPRLVVCAPDAVDEVVALSPALSPARVRSVDGVPAAPDSDSAWTSCRPGPADIALLMYTSGSTSVPHAVVCPHERVLFAVHAVGARLMYRADDVVQCRIPLSFDYGLYQLFLCAAARACVVLRPDGPEAAMLRNARDDGTTVLPVVPSLATLLRRLVARDGVSRAVRVVTSTGAALTAAHAAGLRQAFPRAAVVPMYGMTECKRITIADPDEDLRRPGSVGGALDGTEVTVTDAAGRTLRAGEVGEIRVRGPHVMAGYWRAPEATTERFVDPASPDRLLRTGDEGHLDRGGRLYFVGRRDDIFKRDSVRMSTQEIEAAILDIPGVHMAAVLRPDPDAPLVAWVSGAVAEAEVLRGVAVRLERAKVPDRCIVLPQLPVTVNGKIDRNALLEAVE
jgi:acyl-CoA synthetase (AMP-forming)/AMP-acid ligase II